MSHYLQNEYFQDEEPEDGEYVVERAPFRPKEDVVDVVNKMLYRFFFLGVLLMGIILTFTYKDAIVNPAPQQEMVEEMKRKDIEIQLENERLRQQLRRTQEEGEVMKLVNARHLDPEFPLNNYNRELIIKNWPHVIQGADSQSVKITLEILDMRYDENGLPRNLTPEEVAVLDKKYGKNRKLRHKVNSALMASVGESEDVSPEAGEEEETAAENQVAQNPEGEKPVAEKPEVKNGNGGAAVAEKSPENPPKKVVKRKKKEQDPLRAELTDFVMGQTQLIMDSVLRPAVEPEEEEYEEYEEEVTEEAEAEAPVNPAAEVKPAAEKVEEEPPVDVVYDVDALDAALGMKKDAEE